MFVCCQREGGDAGTEGVDNSVRQSYPSASSRAPELQDDGKEEALFGELKEPLQTGTVEEPPAESPVEPTGTTAPFAGLPIAFRDPAGGKERIATFERTPFGLNFQADMPIRVTDVSGHAAELGVQSGWEIVSCGGVPLGSPSLRFADALEVLRVEADLLEGRRTEAGASGSVSITFRKAPGDVATVSFSKAPLGIDFSQDVPLTVISASGLAAELGVQVGWQVKSVGAVDVDDPQLLAADVVEVLKEEVARLEGGSPTTVDIPDLPVAFASGQTVTFDRPPLGFDINPELPLKVTDVKGQAAKLGVLSGWIVQSVGGARVDDPNLTFADALAIMKSKVARCEARRRRSDLMRTGGLPMLFGTPSGCVGLVFHKTPLGMDLSQSVPITVVEAKGQASELGVEAGWELLSVGGVAVADTAANFQSALAVLEAMVERLRVQTEARGHER